MGSDSPNNGGKIPNKSKIQSFAPTVVFFSSNTFLPQ